MSLVNRVLRDLARRRDHQSDVLAGVSVEARVPRRRWRWPVFLVLLVAFTGLFVFVQMNWVAQMPEDGAAAPGMEGMFTPVPVSETPTAAPVRLSQKVSPARTGPRMLGVRQGEDNQYAWLELVLSEDVDYRLERSGDDAWLLVLDQALATDMPLLPDQLPGLEMLEIREDESGHLQGLQLRLSGEDNPQTRYRGVGVDDDRARLRVSWQHARAEVEKPAPATTAEVKTAQPQLAPGSREPSAREQARRAWQRGERARAEGNMLEAEHYYRKALDHYPRHLEARTTLAGMLTGSARRDEALYVLEAGLALTPENPALRMRKARLMLEDGEVARAVEVLETAAPPVNGHADYHAMLAAAYQRLEAHDRAAQAYRAVLETQPGQSTWWMGLGVSLEALDEPGAALQAYYQARRTGRLSASVRPWVQSRIEVLEGASQP